LPWTLSQPSFDALLARLDVNREQAGVAYEALRRRLVRYFEWQSCDAAEDCADTVLSRLARKIQEGVVIASVQSYALGVARFVVKEAAAAQGRQRTIATQPGDLNQPAPREEEVSQSRMVCLDTCLEQLPARSRDLVLRYYEHQGRAKIDQREAIARQFGISSLALRGRVHRIKAGLEECLFQCLNDATTKRAQRF
jgi:RNA polymerase sigma factor (sigma-70 family)